MKQIYPDLWQTPAEHPFFGVTSHAYLLVRDTGNILFYSSGLHEEHQHIQTLGGITYQYLSHSDEAGPALAEIKKLFGSKLCCHRLEEPAGIKRGAAECRVEQTRDRANRNSSSPGLSIAKIKEPSTGIIYCLPVCRLTEAANG